MADLKAKSRDRWRKLGYHVENGEHYNAHSRKHEDHLGFADLVAVPMDGTPSEYPWPREVGPECAYYVPMAPEHRHPWVYIQSTSWTNVPARVRKIKEEETGRGQWRRPIADLARAVLEAHNLIVVEGWKKVGRLYRLREHWITREDLDL